MTHSRPGLLAVLVQIASLVGAAIAAAGGLASFFAATGTTPAWLYDRYMGLATLTPRTLVLDIPIEFFAAVAFLSIALVTWWGRRRAGIPWTQVTFVFSAIVIGFAGNAAMNDHFKAMPLNAAVAAAVLTLCLASSQPFGLLRFLCTDLPATLRSLLVEPAPRAALFSFACVAALTAQTVHGYIEHVALDDARARAFATWYEAQRPVADPTLQSDRSLKIVVFTDYQCPFSATQVPAVETAVRRFRTTASYPVELVIRDFPLESECNDAPLAVRHDVACEAAAAVRLAQAERGEQAARELALRFYQSNGKMSEALVAERLARLNLGAEFRSRYPALLEEIRADAVAAVAKGVKGTPTIFIDGVRLPGGGSMLEAAMKIEVARR
jgi:protein-disulfide isomerase